MVYESMNWQFFKWDTYICTRLLLWGRDSLWLMKHFGFPKPSIFNLCGMDVRCSVACSCVLEQIAQSKESCQSSGQHCGDHKLASWSFPIQNQHCSSLFASVMDSFRSVWSSTSVHISLSEGSLGVVVLLSRLLWEVTLNDSSLNVFHLVSFSGSLQPKLY